MLKFEIEEVAFEYQKTGKSLTKLAKEYNTTRQTLAKHFKKMGIEIVNRQNMTKFNENVFNFIDTEEKAYWLGFLYADGSISSHKEGQKPKYTLELSLKGSDYLNLSKFNRFMEYENGDKTTISDAICSNTNAKYKRCRWSITNKHLWETLNNYGCTPNKSLTLKFPNENIFKDKSLIRHFIRGYFDGDGCITRHIHIHTVSPAISLLGTSDMINHITKASNISGNIRHDYRHSEDTLTLEFSKDSGIQFINYLYKDSTIFLDRKYTLYEFFKNGSCSVEEFTELLQTNNGESLKLES